MKTIYSDETEMFLVEQDEKSGELFLRVVVGGIAMYEIQRKMTDEMVASFRREPTDLLDFVRRIRLAC